jgi:hypothetical protein
MGGIAILCTTSLWFGYSVKSPEAIGVKSPKMRDENGKAEPVSANDGQ